MSLIDLAHRIQTEGDWCLFLDRDGTINQRIPGEYVKEWSQFQFLPGVLESAETYSLNFKKIFVVTNQQGIGKELMTNEDLDKVHTEMIKNIELHRGYIDEVYHCPFLAVEDPPSRKPNPGMAFQAQQDFEGVQFKSCLMIGDSQSDIDFGHQLGMKTLWVNTKNSASLAPINYDYEISGLSEFASILKNI